jgi:3-dehydroquinate synthase
MSTVRKADLKGAKVIRQTFDVRYQYPVYFTRDLFAAENLVFRDVVSADEKRKCKILLVIDDGLIKKNPGLESRLRHYAAEHELGIVWPELRLPGGEVVKQTPDWVEQVLEAIHLRGIDRHSYVVAIGGGALLDAVGYAAAIAHRGVRLIRIPTTVLSQNDSGVGVKNAINAFGKKNFLGSFAPPYAVLNDLNFLDSLNERDWRSGMAEAVKVALIKDASFFNELEVLVPLLNDRDRGAMERLVFRCAQLHLDHIASGDPFETGSARPLDFGHWVAHRLEFLSGYRLRHGEAVAVGIAVDVIYCRLACYLTEKDSLRILALLQSLGFELWAPELGFYSGDYQHPRSVIRGLEEFREHLGGELTITLLKGIGSGFEVHQLDLSLVECAIEELRTFSEKSQLVVEPELEQIAGVVSSIAT